MRQSIDILLVFRPLRRTKAKGPLCSIDLLLQSLFAADLFFSSFIARLVRVPKARSTGSKQTLNGLFIFISPASSTISVTCPGLTYNFYPLSYFVGPGQSSAILSRRDYITTEVYRWMEKNYALISTSTPEGKSSLDNASTVLEEEV
jgi:hypothetical protein